MPIFLCRWPNGDCSIVLARNETEAVERLDEVANAEGCPMTRIEHLQVHFTLTDDGHLSLERLGEATEDEIFDFCYPELERASAEGEDIVAGVLRERERVRRSDATTPATELGKRAKEQLDMPTTLVDRIVSRTAKRRLKSFKQRGNPN